jgi:DNA-binding beta-propeller fold protein YncE
MKSLCLAAIAVLAVLGVSPAVQAAELELVQTIVLKGKPGGLDHLALDAKRERLFVANKVNNTLDIVDLKAGKLLEQKPNQTAIQGIAYAPDLDRVYVGLGSNGLCNVFDGASYKILKTIKFKDDADNVRYNPSTHLVYVAHAEKELGVIDARTLTVKTNIKLPGAAEAFQMETKRPRIYLNTPSPSLVVVIDTEKNEVMNTYPVKMAGNGHPLVLDEANHRVFVGCRKDQMKEPMIVILDTETGKEVAGVPIPDGVDDIVLDAQRKRLYASCGDGFLVVFQQIDADHLALVEKIPTAKGAKTCLYVPETGRLYLAVPRQEGKEGPEIRVYQAKP